MKEKLYINSIPVYRTLQDDGFIKYVLFEDNEMYSVIVIKEQKTKVDEYKILMEFVADLTGHATKFKSGIRARVDIINPNPK